MKKQKKVLVAMSGGVDSSLTASLLKERGFIVSGVFMNLGQPNAKRDSTAAKAVAKKIGVPFRVVNLKADFKKEIINYFIYEYSIGNTPNPCIFCNKKIKFGLLFKKANDLKFDYLATGHYIKIKKLKDGLHLYESDDQKKDQSYFLYNLKQAQLKYLMFPLEDFKKDIVIQKAKKRKLPHLPQQSQDICFLGGIDHNIFLKKNIKMKKGPIITLDGKVVGEHEGLPLYTVGQRRYIKIGGIGPFYAVRMDYKKNILWVTNKFNDKILYSKVLQIKKFNWIPREKPKVPFKCQARIRYQHLKENCTINKEKNKYIVKFTKPQRAVTPGQSVVFYKGKEVLGGGVIVKSN